MTDVITWFIICKKKWCATFSLEKVYLDKSYFSHYYFTFFNQNFLLSDSTEHTSISVIEFLDENTLLCCCEKLGNISLVDLREKGHKDYPISKTNCMNKTDVKPCSYWTIGVTSDKVYRLSASGDIVVSDVRNGTDSVLSEVSTQLHCTTNHCNIQVQVCIITEFFLFQRLIKNCLYQLYYLVFIFLVSGNNFIWFTWRFNSI